MKYKEKTSDGKITYEITNPNSDWKEWIKTANTALIPLSIEESANSTTFTMSESDVKTHPTAGKIIRQSLKKTAYCLGCRVCETNCKGGHIHFENGKVTITDCIQCHECHDIPAGCPCL